jgi:hypothetical protein
LKRVEKWGGRKRGEEERVGGDIDKGEKRERGIWREKVEEDKGREKGYPRNHLFLSLMKDLGLRSLFILQLYILLFFLFNFF